MKHIQFSVLVGIAVLIALRASGESTPASGKTGEMSIDSVTPVSGSSKTTDKPVKSPGMVVKNGVVLYYSFDERFGKSVVERSGKSGNAVVRSASWTNDGVVGGSCMFNGNSSLVVSRNNNLNFKSQFSLSVWIRPTMTNGVRLCIVSKNNGTDGYDLYWSNAPHKSEVVFMTRNSWLQSGCYMRTAVPMLNKWSHIVLTYNDTNAVRFYLNGDPCEVISGGKKSMSGILPEKLPGRNAEKVLIGTSEHSLKGFVGAMDEFLLFNRELSAEEVKRIYQAQKPTDYRGLGSHAKSGMPLS